MNNTEIIFNIFIMKLKSDIKSEYKNIENIDYLLDKIFKDIKKEDLKKYSTENKDSNKKIYISNSAEVKQIVKAKKTIINDLIKIYPEFNITYSPKKIYKQINDEFPEENKARANELADKFSDYNDKLKILNKQKIMN